MSDKKPNVFPSTEMIEQANETSDKIQEQLVEEQSEQPTTSLVSDGEKKAAAEMLKKTAEQLKLREERMAENQAKADETEKLRVKTFKKAEEEKAIRDNIVNPPVAPPTPPPVDDNQGDNQLPEDNDGLTTDMVRELSEPQWDAPYDVIPLPSEGKLYKSKKSSIKVAYLNASDENLLTSPNIVGSDRFMEILINRKILEADLRYGDLHIGDRNAIMILIYQPLKVINLKLTQMLRDYSHSN